MAHSSGADAHKGLPTFRAGGSTARNDLATSRVDDGINHKSALKTSFFSHDHFSSSLAKSEGVRFEQFVRARPTRALLRWNFSAFMPIEPRCSPFTICPLLRER